MASLFRKPDPAEAVKKWKRDLRKEMRTVDHTIREIELQEMKTKRIVRERAKAGDAASARVLAKELVRSKQTKEQLYTSKAQLNSVSMQLQEQLSMLRVTGAMKNSVGVMQAMNKLVKLPQLHAAMMAMGMEMEKAGLIEEMVADTLDSGQDLEMAADEEVEKIFAELTAGLFENVPVTPVVQQEDVQMKQRVQKLRE
eukprot:TRINITY_DN11715_c0_g1_i1.p1 TRINITY_DN11715_c0_g1~~TRINITY_DN11715_c0_g1_i1.p1  ORF type:complete len:198 (-),score=84.39 TRINITY_DN11715_c0_g1_i1:92-685(-)